MFKYKSTLLSEKPGRRRKSQLEIGPSFSLSTYPVCYCLLRKGSRPLREEKGNLRLFLFSAALKGPLCSDGARSCMRSFQTSLVGKVNRAPLLAVWKRTHVHWCRVFAAGRRHHWLRMAELAAVERLEIATCIQNLYTDGIINESMVRRRISSDRPASAHLVGSRVLKIKACTRRAILLPLRTEMIPSVPFSQANTCLESRCSC